MDELNTDKLDMSKAKEVIIPIDDWRDDVVESGTFIDSEDTIYRLLDEGMSTGDIAKAAIVSRELSIMPELLMRANKSIFYSGSRAEISSIAKRRTHSVTAANGAELRAPVYIGRYGQRYSRSRTFDASADAVKDDDEVSYVNAENNPTEAADRAILHLERMVIGYVRNVLVTVHGGYGNGKVREVAEQHKNAIDEIVHLLTDPQLELEPKDR